MRIHFSFVFFVLMLLIYNGCTEHHDKSKLESSAKKTELELVLPNKLLDLDCQGNQLYVFLRNGTDSGLTVYFKDNARDNMYISFEIKTPDSTYKVTRKESGWAHNITRSEKIEAGECFVFPCNLMAYTCYIENGKEKPMLRGDYNGWAGLPAKMYDSAWIKAIFEDTDLGDSTSENWSRKIESRFYKIKVEKLGNSYIPFRRIIDVR